VNAGLPVPVTGTSSPIVIVFAVTPGVFALEAIAIGAIVNAKAV
jgi:hypothetical protein